MIPYSAAKLHMDAHTHAHTRTHTHSSVTPDMVETHCCVRVNRSQWTEQKTQQEVGKNSGCLNLEGLHQPRRQSPWLTKTFKVETFRVFTQFLLRFN